MPRARAKTSRTPLARLRKVCLALPEAHEVEAWGEPTFRVRNKLFAMYASGGHHSPDGASVWCKSTHVNQDLLIRSDAAQYFSPPYVGPSGWIGVRLNSRTDWETLEGILTDGYCLIAPKRLAAKVRRE